ncbi:MAG TPA: thiamine-phosphate kinase [Pyrinomonadaceae bacterium]|nr:thiamine-phosphate kinase [Pyrinomonadaceae bacterium]
MRSEFEFIRNIKDKYGLRHVGDDCAVLPKDSKTDCVVTADMLVEDIDFRIEWTTPQLLGVKALAVSLSDIAAMGATPKWAMLTIGVPERIWNTDFLDKFYEGWTTLAKHHDVPLIGGDVSRTPDKIVIDSIVAGEVPKGKAILRSGAKPGDSIFVTGSLGGAAGGLILLESGFRYSKVGKRRKALIARQLRPTARVEAGKHLMSRSLATAMIDISDGLRADLYHLCDASAVGARLESTVIPYDENLSALMPASEWAGLGGEDFELLFTSPRKKISSAKLPLITRIGEITTNVGVVEVVAENLRRAPRTGYRHF